MYIIEFKIYEKILLSLCDCLGSALNTREGQTHFAKNGHLRI